MTTEGLDAGTRRRIAELSEDILTLRLDERGDDWLERLLPAVADLFEADSVLTYVPRIQLQGCSIATMHVHGRGDPETVVREFDESLRRTAGYVALYNPAKVEPFQRDVAMQVGTWRQLRRSGTAAMISVDRLDLAPGDHERVFQGLEELERPFSTMGVVDHEQLRVLLCEGATMMAWFGVFRAGPFDEPQRACLEALVPALKRRFAVEARFDDDACCEALETALDAISGAAYLVDEHGRVQSANSTGRARYDREGRNVRALAQESITGKLPPGVQVLPVRGRSSRRMRLLVEPSLGNPDVFVAAAAHRYGLTPRETEVAALVLRGISNKCIAARLGCAQRTVEIHVSRLLAKSGTDSRAEFTARVCFGI